MVKSPVLAILVRAPGSQMRPTIDINRERLAAVPAHRTPDLRARAPGRCTARTQSKSCVFAASRIRSLPARSSAPPVKSFCIAQTRNFHVDDLVVLT